MNKKEQKENLIARQDSLISQLKDRIEARRIQFEYENAKDQEKIDELELMHSGLKKLK